MFVNTTGDLPRGDLLEWLRRGGSFIGVHGASDTLHGDPDYIEMLGGEFDHHPAETTGQVFVDDHTHPAAAVLEAPYALFEEFYLFKNFASDRVRVPTAATFGPRHGSSSISPVRSPGGCGAICYRAVAP
jgi:type 1 glutamine amidotransferase